MKHHQVDQNTPEWDALRLPLPTASEASRLVSPLGKLSDSVAGYAEEVALAIHTGGPVKHFSGSRATDRGHALEPVAAAWYAYETSTEPVKCGFFTDNLRRYGASPDLLVGLPGLVEIKCQETVGHWRTFKAYRDTGEMPSKHYPQLQMLLMTTQRKWVDLCLYHPSLPCSIIRVVPDLAFHKLLKQQIAVFIKLRDLELQSLQGIAA